MTKFFGWAGRFSVKYRWFIVAIWVIGTIVAVRSFPSLASQVNNDNSDFLPSSAPSYKADALAKPLIGKATLSQVQVVAITSNPKLSTNDETALRALQEPLSKVVHVTKVSLLGVSPDGKVVQLNVTSSSSAYTILGATALIHRLQTVINQAAVPSDLKLYLAGGVVNEVASQGQSNKQGGAVQKFSILFILLLLLLIFRALLTPFITLMGPVFALLLSSSLIGELGAHGLKISFITQVLLIVLLLGAGTDYGLFLVFRVREELLSGRTPKDAVGLAMARVAESISASALTVIVALLTLTLASFGVYHDLGIPLAIGVGVMLIAGLTLLPALLAIFGRAAFWPTKTTARAHADGLWGRIAGRLVHRPLMTLGIGVVVFAALALAALGYKSGGFGGSTTPPSGTAAAKASSVIHEHFPQSNSNPTNLILTFAHPIWTNPAPLVAAQKGLEESPLFTTITGPLNPNGKSIKTYQLTDWHKLIHTAPQTLAEVEPIRPSDSPLTQSDYDAYLSTATFISDNGLVVQFEVGLKGGTPQSTTVLQEIPGVRAALTKAAKLAGATHNGVAGEAPALYDVSKVSGSDLTHIIPIAVLAIGLVLILVLRSLVAPIYLIVSVVLSYLASLGLAVLVFLDSHKDKGIVFLLPFLMFIFLLALGEDYNILVMTRIREEAHKLPLKEAVVRAIGATGPTVTSAGLVLAGSFTVLAVVGGSGSGGSEIQQIGFGLAVGILLDTFIVRTVLVPSTVSLLGRLNWWPSKLGRHIVEEASL